MKQQNEELSQRYEKMSDDKIAVMDTLRDLESDYRIVKEDLKALEEKYRDSNQQLQQHITAATAAVEGDFTTALNSTSQLAKPNRTSQPEAAKEAWQDGLRGLSIKKVPSKAVSFEGEENAHYDNNSPLR